jgi:hypothetical protein
MEYQCGLRAGDRVRLRRDIAVTQDGRLTGTVHSAGEIWKVLSGASGDPGVVFLLQPDNKRHTWDDKQSIYDMFELVESKEAGQRVSEDEASSHSGEADTTG